MSFKTVDFDYTLYPELLKAAMDEWDKRSDKPSLDNLKIVDYDGRGRGVSTTNGFHVNDVIELAEVFLVPATQVSSSELNSYAYYWDEDNCAIALGNGSLYNHSNKPNVKFKVGNRYITYTAKRDIKAGEELTIDYAQGLSKKDRKQFLKSYGF